MSKRNGIIRRRPIAVDLFCGAGGMCLGFEQAGFDVVLGVDLDGHHVATHARNFPHSKTLLRSVADLDAVSLYEAIGGEVAIDVVFGGPPCQGFSHMGLRDVADSRNSLIGQFARVVAELRPKAFVMENVPGLISGDMRPVLDETIKFLKRKGYRITDPIRLLDASEFGVPQKRKRLFLLGLRDDLPGTISYPNSPCAGQPPRPTVWEAISDLPTIENRKELFARDDVQYDKPPVSEYARVARAATDDPSDFSYPREWDGGRCTGCLRIRHTERALSLYASTPPGQMVLGHKLPRLDSNGIAPTLRAGSDSTHGSYTAPRPIHPRAPRCITAREAARLHGFPDWFAFYPLKWHAYRQIGNAVCPPVARAIGREVLSVLGLTPVKPRGPIQLPAHFVLPASRPRSRKRIPHIVHYPPVVLHLFQRAYDDDEGRLKRRRFTFADVQKAIRATGVNLSWTRADTFVPEIARSRNIRRILEPCLEKGYTIRAIADGDYIGEFVPVGETGTVELKETLNIRVRDVADAIIVKPSMRIDLQSPHTLPLLLLEREVISTLWQGRKIGLDVDIPPNGNGKGLQVAYRLRTARGVVGGGWLMVSSLGRMPNRARIARLAQETSSNEIVVFVPVSKRHVLVTRFDTCMTAPREAHRQVYEVSAPRKSTRKERST